MVKIENNFVYVDVGRKSEGVIPLKEFTKNGAELVLDIEGEINKITVDNEGVSINKKSKTVVFIKDGKVSTVILD